MTSRIALAAWLVAGCMCLSSCAEMNLRSCVKNGSLAGTRQLIEQDHVSPEIPDQCGWTLLHFAAYYQHAPIAEYLISRGADVDAQTKFHSARCIPYSKIPKGSTPLAIAAYYGHTDVISVLVKHGAKPDLKNDEGYSALDYAKKFEFPQAVKEMEPAVRSAPPTTVKPTE